MEKDLEKAIQDWQPDAETPKSEVTLIEDPYGFGLDEIKDQQSLDEELNIDQELVEADLASLRSAIEKSDQEHAQTVETLTEESALESAERLAAQIAEDEALTALMAHEAQEASDADPANEPSESPTSAQPLDLEEVQSSVEAFLFLSDQPIKLEKLHQAISPETPLEIFATAMEAIQLNFQKPTHGIELAQIAGGYQFRTKPERASITKKLSKIQTQRLSSGAMETLAIIAYRQPVMKEDIDKIRGVDSSHFVRGLLEKRLIEISGRSELPGRPMLYTTTPEFLQLFGLNALDSMPSLRELEQMIPASQSQQSEDDPRVREMRRLVSDMKANAESILHYDPKEDEKILKEIRDRVNQIPTSTPTLIAQAEAEKAAPPPSEPASGPELLPLGQ